MSFSESTKLPIFDCDRVLVDSANKVAHRNVGPNCYKPFNTATALPLLIAGWRLCGRTAALLNRSATVKDIAWPPEDLSPLDAWRANKMETL